MKKKLVENCVESAENTSLVLLSHVLDQPKSWILSHGEYELKPEDTHTLQTNLDQSLQGVPLPYILGYWDFYGRTFEVTPDVLIPRPETELLVEKALNHTQKQDQPLIVDVGTGSGIIAISLAADLPSATVLALDLSLAALRVAQRNALKINQTQVHFIQSNLLEPFHVAFDLICANLPYIQTNTLNNLEVARWEPQLALDGGESGLNVIEKLLQQSRSRLASPGVILLEIESSLGEVTLAAAKDVFPKAHIQLIRDLAGHDRIVEIYQE